VISTVQAILSGIGVRTGRAGEGGRGRGPPAERGRAQDGPGDGELTGPPTWTVMVWVVVPLTTVTSAVSPGLSPREAGSKGWVASMAIPLTEVTMSPTCRQAVAGGQTA